MSTDLWPKKKKKKERKQCNGGKIDFLINGAGVTGHEKKSV